MSQGAPDVRLVERARRGDADAFTVIYDDLAPRILRFLHHHVADPDLAEELMQRTFVKVIEALPRFEVRGSVPFRAWVFRLARNVVIDDHRTSHPALDVDAIADPPSDDPTPAEALERNVQRDELLAAIDRLPQDQHDVILYRFFADLSPRETAPLMHRSEGAVRVLQHRAVGRLRSLLATGATIAPLAGAET